MRARIALLLLFVLPAAARAQARNCDLVSPSDFTRSQTPQGEYIEFRTPVRFRCTGGVTISANRAVSIGWTQELQLIGNAFYESPERRITANNLNHIGSQNRLTGSGNVVVTDRQNGSVIRGESLVHDYERGEVESRTVVRGGRPHATVPSRPEPGDTAAQPPLEVDAEFFDITGQRVFRAFGDVRFTRGDTRGAAREIEFDEGGNRVSLRVGAVMENERFRLAAENIDAETAGDRLRQVDARGAAQLTARDVAVNAADLRIYFDEGRLNRLVALRRNAGDGAPARAESQGFRLAGDSIDARAPGEVIEELVAVGSAYGERDVDSVAVGLPDIAQHDWLRGDTITAYFEDAPAKPATAVADTAAPERVLERLIAVAADGAQSLHRIQQEGSQADASVNYLVAQRITVQLRAGEVHKVDAVGAVRGVHLQPVAAPRAAPEEGAR